MRRIPNDSSRSGCRTRQPEADRRNPRATKKPARRAAVRSKKRARAASGAPRRLVVSPEWLVAYAHYSAVLERISEAVDASIQGRRWADLEAAIADYSRHMRVDPTMLLFCALLRAMYRHALQMTDLPELEACLQDMRECEQLAKSRQPLSASIELLREGLERAAAMAAFDRITAAPTMGAH